MNLMGSNSSHSNNTEQYRVSIPLWRYNVQQRRWVEKQRNEHNQTINLDKFRVVTYNVWFAGEFQPMRFNSLRDLLYKSQAQVIGLQEVTTNILQLLLSQPFVQERYYISDIDGRTFNGWYGVILLIDLRLKLSNLNLINFPQSNMGRRLIFAEIKLSDNEILHIGTVHLESLDNTEERLRQLNICQRALHHPQANCILMGDFNFSAESQENIDQFNRLPGWIDVWAYLMGLNNRGYTFDTEANLMTKARHQRPLRSRCDRIILLSQTFLPTDIEILGNKSIGKQEDFHVFTSDHFGLTASFQKKHD